MRNTKTQLHIILGVIGIVAIVIVLFSSFYYGTPFWINILAGLSVTLTGIIITVMLVERLLILNKKAEWEKYGPNSINHLLKPMYFFVAHFVHTTYPHTMIQDINGDKKVEELVDYFDYPLVDDDKIRNNETCVRIQQTLDILMPILEIWYLERFDEFQGLHKKTKYHFKYIESIFMKIVMISNDSKLINILSETLFMYDIFVSVINMITIIYSHELNEIPTEQEVKKIYFKEIMESLKGVLRAINVAYRYILDNYSTKNEKDKSTFGS